MSKNNFSKPSKKKHKKVLNYTKSFKGRAKSCFRIALQRNYKGLIYSYIDRKKRKSVFRKFLIQNISFFLINSGVKYSVFISILKKANFKFNKKQILQSFMRNNSIFASFIYKIRNQNYI